MVTHTSTNTDDAAAPDGAAAAREPVISVSGLTKQYGEVQAVRGIDFEVARGETFGFLGPNGAGKTTTIKILCTLANATSGTARVAGHDGLLPRPARTGRHFGRSACKVRVRGQSGWRGPRLFPGSAAACILISGNR